MASQESDDLRFLRDVPSADPDTRERSLVIQVRQDVTRVGGCLWSMIDTSTRRGPGGGTCLETMATVNTRLFMPISSKGGRCLSQSNKIMEAAARGAAVALGQRSRWSTNGQSLTLRGGDVQLPAKVHSRIKWRKHFISHIHVYLRCMVSTIIL